MFDSKVAWLLFYCSAQLQQQTEALRPNSLAELNDGRGRQSQNVNNFSRLISWNFCEIFINSSLRCFVSGKIEEKVRTLANFDYWIIREISIGVFSFMGSCQKLNNFIDVKKDYFIPFEYLICFAKLSRIHSLYQVFLLD